MVTTTTTTMMTTRGGFAVDSHGGRRRGSSGPHPGEEGVGSGGARQQPRRPHRFVRRPPTTWQHCHRLIAASSSSPLPLSPHRPLPALACRQREDIATTIVATTSSLRTNESVHPRKESHGVCHGHSASSDLRNIVGITHPPDGAAVTAANDGDPREVGGERRPGKPSL